MEYTKRKSVQAHLNKYNGGSTEDIIEVTEWANGEGYDISIQDKVISLHYSEVDAINHLILSLQYDYHD